MTQQHKFQIYLPGLLKVLAESLYSTRKVAIRELIQNAHDSTVRRQNEAQELDYQPRIHIQMDVRQRRITIRDNGSGLTENEIGDYLATIGRSYTRQLGESLSILSPEEASKLIGQFGMGFLSAFLIASEVRLITRSARPNNPALEWKSTGDVHYDLREIPEAEIGTTVHLSLKPSAAFLLNEQLLVETIQQYANFVPTPVYVGTRQYPVNIMQPPWERPNPRDAIRLYIETQLGDKSPIAIIPLGDYTVDLGHDQMTIPMQGFLFIPGLSIASIREHGDMTVYIRRMFICTEQRNLLPAWARFVRGMIDCPFLQPTASREELHQDDTFLVVQQAIEEQLIEGLRLIADTDPKTWQQIVRGHADVIMGWAVQDDLFFDQIADIMTFRTSRGRMTLPAFLEQTNGKIYFVTRELGSLQEQLLGEGHGIPVLEAAWFGVQPFLRKYVYKNPNIELVQLDGQSEQLFQEVPDDAFATLLTFYRDEGINARVATFKPHDVPAVILYPKDAEFIVSARQSLDGGDVPNALTGLVKDYVNRLSEQTVELDGTLYLNVSSPLILALNDAQDATLQDAALKMIYQVARLFSGRMLNTQQIIASFQMLTSSITTMLDSNHTSDDNKKGDRDD